MNKSKKTDKLLPPVKIVEETKEKVENIKKDAKQYYKGKNLIIRYVFIGFLLILLALQFFLPSMKDNNNVDSNDNANLQSDTQVSKIYDLETSMEFLGEEIDINIPAFDEAKATILSDKQQLLILYKKRPEFLARYENAFKKAGLSIDYMYLAFINGLSDNLWFLPGEAVEKYKLQENDYIDELYSADKTTRVAIDYLKSLEKKYNDPKLALLGYIMGTSALDSLIEEQGVETFNELYLEDFLNSWYYSVAAYKYIFEHIPNYVDTENTTTYPIKDTKIVAVREIEDLALWSKDHGDTIKEIKELNPWILENKLPKGKWEIEVYKK